MNSKMQIPTKDRKKIRRIMISRRRRRNPDELRNPRN